MECVCGCGREYGERAAVSLNGDALVVQQELVEWDGVRLLNRSLSNFGDGGFREEGQLDPFIEAGADLYQTMLAVLHGELPADALDRRGLKRWTKFSRKSRRGMPLAVRTEKFLTPRPEDKGKINLRHPELTHTGPDPDGQALAGAGGIADSDAQALECFCGCGRRISPEIEGMNINGTACMVMIDRLRAARVTLGKPPLVGDPDAEQFVPMCEIQVGQGESTVERWKEILHSGGELLPPGDAADFMEAFSEWGEGATWMVAVVEGLPTMGERERAELRAALDEE